MKKLIISLVVIALLTGSLSHQTLAQEPVECEAEYTVQAGDWLSKIAEKYYGDVTAYEQMVAASNARSDDDYTDIGSPDLIEPGLYLCLPPATMVAQQPAPAPDSSPQLVGPIWQWQQTQMNNGDLFTPDNPANYTIQFMADGTAAIQADCNTVQATYTVTDNRVSLEMGPSTLIACPEGSMGDQFIRNLTGANSFFFQEGNLFIELMFDSGTMSFSPISSDLAGSNWIVINYNNGREAVVGLIEGTELTANFGQDGTLSGSAGCNSYSAGYEAGGNNISIGQAAVTMMFCEEPAGVMEQEQEFLAALSTAATYQITGNTMQMRTADDALVAMFTRAAASTLAGSNWMVTNYNNGREAVVGLIEGTELTADFGQDGTLSGSAGCNNYSVGYQVDGGNISIEQAAVTMMLCEEPAGVMEQEQEFLAALSTAATYQITGNTMQMRTAEDALAAMFTRAAAPAAVAAEPAVAEPTLADQVMNSITMVQHSFNTETNNTSFTCASPGQGLNGVAPDAAGARFVGPNAGDFDLWGAVGLFQVDPDGTATFVPQQTGGKFVDPDGFEYRRIPLGRVLVYFSAEQAIWTGDFGLPGRIEKCDPTTQ